MNLEQQRALIKAQLATIKEDESCRIIEQENDFELHLDVAIFTGRRYHLMLDLSRYDLEPPALYVLDGERKSTWDADKVPAILLNGNQHPGQKRDFFCVPGTSDYHSHPHHAHERWDGLRNATHLYDLVEQLKNQLKRVKASPLFAPDLQGVILSTVGFATDGGKQIQLGLAGGGKACFARLDLWLDDGRLVQLVPAGQPAGAPGVEIKLEGPTKMETPTND